MYEICSKQNLVLNVIPKTVKDSTLVRWVAADIGVFCRLMID